MRQLLLFLLGVRLDAQSKELLTNLPSDRYLVVSNHVSLLDGPIVSMLHPKPLVGPVAAEYCTGVFGYGVRFFAWLTGSHPLPLDRNKPTKGTIALLKKAQQNSIDVLVFPAGAIGVECEKEGASWLADKLSIKRKLVFSITKRKFGFSVSVREEGV